MHPFGGAISIGRMTGATRLISGLLPLQPSGQAWFDLSQVTKGVVHPFGGAVSIGRMAGATRLISGLLPPQPSGQAWLDLSQ